MKLCLMLCMFMLAFDAIADEKIGKLQTLFTTPAERYALDKYRSHGKFKPVTTHTKSASRPVARVVLQGVVVHGNHSPIAFINDQATHGHSSLNKNIQVNTANTESTQGNVAVTVNNHTRQLKPGQVWDTSRAKPVEQSNLHINQQDGKLKIQNQ